MHKSEKITLYSVLINIFLFVAKLIVGIYSQSLALLSDAVNSFLDILSYSGIHFAVKISNQKADAEHPFGHKRAEPIAGLFIAIFAGILGFEISKNAIKSLINPSTLGYGNAAVIVLVISMIVKIIMYKYMIKKGEEMNRPAIKAAGIDSRNDVLASGVALIGVIGNWYGLYILDSVAAIIISIIIFYSGYEIAIENINYLMGHAPPKKNLDKIKKTVVKIKGVKGCHDVKAHYVGPYVQVEIHIEVDNKLNTKESHKISNLVQEAVENLDRIDKAFIHVDPV